MIEGEWYMPTAPLFSVRICINKRLNTDKLPNCAGRGSRGLADQIEQLLIQERLPVEVIRGPCMNNCQIGPNIKIHGGELFNLNGDLSEARIAELMVAIRAEVERRKSAAAQTPATETK
ncbi:MAG: (2Fe-2S) ferredoxin domain-containing protein [Rhodospirillaceae bacterium]|nr:MAG: (2Fe-2S) ferredoxin domain-containing protein [Rhodospirillaceae bacterium]